MRRVPIAFLASPVLAILTLSVVAVLLLGRAQGGDAAFILVVFVLPVAYLSTLLFGVPLFFLFKRRQWLSWWQSLVGGLLCATPFVAFLLYSDPSLALRPAVDSLLSVSLGVGALVGVLFWALAIRKNAP